MQKRETWKTEKSINSQISQPNIAYEQQWLNKNEKVENRKMKKKISENEQMLESIFPGRVPCPQGPFFI